MSDRARLIGIAIKLYYCDQARTENLGYAKRERSDDWWWELA